MKRIPIPALVATDMPASTDFDSAIPHDRKTIVTLDHDHAYPADTDSLKFLSPGVFAWHEEEGRAVHRDLELLAWRIADQVEAKGQSGGLAGAPTALKFLLVDGLLWPYFLLRRFQAASNAFGADGRRVLFFRDRFLEAATKTMLILQGLGRQNSGKSDAICGVTDASVKRSVKPLIVKDPRKARLLRRLDRVGKRVWRQYRRLQRAGYLPRTAGMPENALEQQLRGPLPPNLANKFDSFAASLLSRETSGKPMAVLCWNCRDWNYANALLRTLREIVAVRPALLFLEGKTELVLREIENLSRSAAYQIIVVPIDELSTLVKGHGEQSLAEVTEILSALSFDPELGPSEVALLQHVGANYVRTSASLKVFYALLELLRRIPRERVSYGLFASARAAYYAAVAECLGRLGVPTVDVHIYLVGNHARQMAPPTHYAAVIDNQQEALLSSFWGWPVERCVRVGYLWREPVSPPGEEHASQPHAPVVIICTQPGETDMVKGFFADALDALSSLGGAQVLVKPHPSETEVTLNFYMDCINAHPSAGQISLLKGKDRLTDIMKGADLVVTRTSNAGIEAALMGKPTLRYLAYDLYDRSVEHDVAYARTIKTREELIAALAELVQSAEARVAQVLAQEPYLRENPAQAFADGPRRLVAFMEDKGACATSVEPGEEMALHA